LKGPDPGGVPTTVWTGEIPLRWEHAEIHRAGDRGGRANRDGRDARRDLLRPAIGGVMGEMMGKSREISNMLLILNVY